MPEKENSVSGASQNRDNFLSHSGIMVLPNNEEDLEINIWIPLLFSVYSTVENVLANLLKPTFSTSTWDYPTHSYFL